MASDSIKITIHFKWKAVEPTGELCHGCGERILLRQYQMVTYANDQEIGQLAFCQSCVEMENTLKSE